MSSGDAGVGEAILTAAVAMDWCVAGEAILGGDRASEAKQRSSSEEHVEEGSGPASSKSMLLGHQSNILIHSNIGAQSLNTLEIPGLHQTAHDP